MAPARVAARALIALILVLAAAAATTRLPGTIAAPAPALGRGLPRARAAMDGGRAPGAAPWERGAAGRSGRARVSGPGRNQNERRGNLVRGMMLPQPKGTLSPPLAEDDPLAPLVYAVARAGDERKARGIRALRVAALTTVTSFFVVMTGNSKTQVQAISAHVRDEVGEGFGRDAQPQGDPASGWVVLDYGDVIAHIFTPEVKDFYDLERLWQNGQELSLERAVSPEGLTPAAAADAWAEEGGAADVADDIWGEDDEGIWG